MIILPRTSTQSKNRFHRRRTTRKSSRRNCTKSTRPCLNRTSSKESMLPRGSAQIMRIRATVGNTIRPRFPWIRAGNKSKVLLVRIPNRLSETLVKANFRKFLRLTLSISRMFPESTKTCRPFQFLTILSSSINSHSSRR